MKELQSVVESRHGKVKLVPVKGNPRAVIIKTTNEVVPLLRDGDRPLTLRGKKLEPILTSGAVGNLKKRALEARAHDQVSER